MFDPSIPQPLRDKVDRELENGERIEWIGMPKRVFFTPASSAAFLFGLVWTAFALFWVAGAAGFKIPQFNRGFDWFPLFGIPMFLIGFGLLSVPIWAYKSACKSVYVITDRRAITFIGGWSTTIRSFPPENLPTSIAKKNRTAPATSSSLAAPGATPKVASKSRSSASSASKTPKTSNDG